MSDQAQTHDETERLIQSFLGGEEPPPPADHRSGYVAVVGKPNVGKSTLVNALIGHKVAIISPKPQTTRRRILGILTREDAQVLFLDTPGVHEPKQALNRYMMREVDAALKDCDAILFVTDVSRLPTDEDQRVAEHISRLPQPKLLAMNKADLLDPRDVVEHVAAHEALLPQPQTDAATEAPGQAQARSAAAIFDLQTSILTSGTRGDNLDKLLNMILNTLPYGPRYFPPGQFTDQNARFLAAEFVREQALRFLEQEVPHGIAVAIEEWQPRPNGVIYIAATVYVERESHKGILIGKEGEMLKKIGANARKEIERELGTKVYLELWAKVRPGWRRDDVWVARLMGAGA
ncbi:MAG: GTPase Era [Chloroflexi bacterium]|jgi:GTP-binding protein Era|uniref:GTPase Era n=1 Tax=Candidatus Thermofonsia Clade 3 bacterium TaxID=2364212 RepID=A0A2M8QH05_9CHLR|nr:GTPase Era [Candidatus Roseilinea sp. NK_OTU-006]PJF49090.1 MAG: GTPase Era [Candidatus Thermofonsia Clade 3 bacterium]RMG62742.1 MAG: GTPase Era [Chloroflexota bacterium]